jgi:hypothetical protein
LPEQPTQVLKHHRPSKMRTTAIKAEPETIQGFFGWRGCSGSFSKTFRGHFGYRATRMGEIAEDTAKF